MVVDYKKVLSGLIFASIFASKMQKYIPTTYYPCGY